MRIRQHLATGAVLAAVLALTPVPARAAIDPGLIPSSTEAAGTTPAGPPPRCGRPMPNSPAPAAVPIMLTATDTQ
jgi:hypothetical protein